MSTTRRHRTLWDALVGVAAALLVFGAVPGVLLTLVGLPFPTHWTSSDVISWRGLFDLLAVVSWCAWAACAWPILRSAASRVRSGDVAAGGRLSDRIGLRIALGVLALSSFFGVGASVAGVSVAGGSAAAAKVAQASASVTLRRPAATAPTRTSTVTVARGDTLPTLASTRYGDPWAWSAIASANLGRLMNDGTRFIDPRAIAPGWTLFLPELDARTTSVTATPGGLGARRAQRAHSAEVAARSPSPGGSLLPLAELAAAGLSALVAALLARRSRQLRRLQAFLREEGQESPAPTEPQADLAALVAPFEGVPLPAIVEAAARHLGHSIATLDPSPGPVQWLRVGRDGVEAKFSDPVPDSVRGWTPGEAGTWRLPPSVDVAALEAAAGSADPWCAVLLPLGDDDRGTWLLPVAAGSCVAVLGPRAAELVQAMRAALATWSWHEDLFVTEDAAQAAEAVRRCPPPPTGAPGAGPHVLFVGDPHALTAATRRGCAALTTGQVDDAEVTVVVDARWASAHPLGLTVRPPLLDPSWAAAVDELVDPARPDPRPTARPLVHRRVPATLRLDDAAVGVPPAPDLFSWATPSPSATRQPDAAPAPPRCAPGSRAAGAAEVQLLTTVPGIVGLQADLPPKRARRAVEVVAYLAMHAPDPVTGDRLRTRVLGSGDADAAAKTLFNTVGAARRALGTGPDGKPLLPPASRTGHYRLSPLVSVDAVRAWALLRDGLASRDRVESASTLREGLELVRAEPLGGVLTGYSWWRAEGHERRLADAVVDGACALVRHALGDGDIDLARWALAQARKVEPSCEPLTRAAMRVAAASGDARRLRAEWEECQRQIDELDPGGMPSERTEQLYALLRAQLSGDGAQVGVVPA